MLFYLFVGESFMLIPSDERSLMIICLFRLAAIKYFPFKKNQLFIIFPSILKLDRVL